MEGVVFQYEPPLHEATDPVAAQMARTLSTMESAHSSQVKYEQHIQYASYTVCVRQYLLPGKEQENRSICLTFSPTTVLLGVGMMRVTDRPTDGPKNDRSHPRGQTGEGRSSERIMYRSMM